MDRQKELREAIDAADAALRHLESANRMLRSSGRWGCLDLIGGGILVTLLKHAEMRDARRELDAAREAVSSFGRELKDVAFLMDVNLDTADLLGVADYFLDGPLADTLMQLRIEDARSRVSEVIGQIEAIRRDLVREYERIA
ncbi:MAG: hypothetical protein K5746_07770 [Clostridiales bacterium]|nr:hypothetical protein [Clostridiales bacterium]